MYNENVVRFEPYVAYYFAELLVFLEEIADAALNQMHFELNIEGVKNYCAGYSFIVQYIKTLEGELRASKI
jgi:hypothetical protein